MRKITKIDSLIFESRCLKEKCTILIVDNSTINTYLLKKFFESEKFKVITCNNGEQAINFLLNIKIDLLITDLFLSDISGTDLIDFIRTNNLTKFLPIIVTSFIDCYELRDHLMQKNIVDFIAKPINKDLIINAVYKSLENNLLNTVSEPNKQFISLQNQIIIENT